MMSPQEAARALRGERIAIVRAWLSEVKEQLWHLDSTLFSRRGPATVCALETIGGLIEWHVVRAELGPPNPAQGRHTLNTPEPHLAPYATRWADLPVVWADIRGMGRILERETLLALARRGADADTLALHAGFGNTLTVAVSDIYFARQEQAYQSYRAETITTHYLDGRFLANASHELRTPLTAILGFAELLLEDTYGPLTPEQRTTLQHIENSAHNLQESANNLLDMLHIRIGTLQTQTRSLAVAAMLHHLFTILTPLADRKGVLFHLDLPHDLGAIETDENLLRHSIYHLLASAIRATPAGGTVTLSAQREDRSLVISTHDTALHLPEAAHASMRNPFPTLENVPTRGYEGWEIGLPLVRRYLEIIGGQLQFESLPEQGTTFCITLPLTPRK